MRNYSGKFPEPVICVFRLAIRNGFLSVLAMLQFAGILYASDTYSDSLHTVVESAPHDTLRLHGINALALYYSSHDLTKHTRMNISYVTQNECEAKLHGKNDLWSRFASSVDVLIDPPWANQVLNEETILKLIFDNDLLGGFVLVRGGEELINDQASKVTGTILVRNKVSPEELGPHAKQLLRSFCTLDQKIGETDDEFKLRVDHWTEKEMITRTKKDVTLLRRKIPDSSVVSLPIRQFKWLVQKRNFSN